MHDPYVTRESMVRDTLSHRAGLGLGAGDLMFWPDTDRTRDDDGRHHGVLNLDRRLRHHVPLAPPLQVTGVPEARPCDGATFARGTSRRPQRGILVRLEQGPHVRTVQPLTPPGTRAAHAGDDLACVT